MAAQNLNPAPVLITIGGSAGSLDVLLQLLPEWRYNNDAAMVIVLHRKADSESMLDMLLTAKCGCPVTEAKDKHPILPGHIYLAPADYHLLIEADHTFSLDYSEKINFSRPSIDASFDTAALAYGSRLICMLLSGANTDGTLGLKMASANGAHIIVQSPASAITPFMPQSALYAVQADAVLKPDQMIEYLERTIYLLSK